jgi:hypothetical protein
MYHYVSNICIHKLTGVASRKNKYEATNNNNNNNNNNVLLYVSSLL